MSDTLPPGVTSQGDAKFTHFASGGAENSWLPFEQVKHYTNAFIVQNDRVLLGYKKRGFGKGKYNGFGGKVEPGETSLQAAARELEEESGVKAKLEHAGSFFFHAENADFAFQIEIYRAEEYDGEITETDEMRPEWFSTRSTQGNDDPTSAPNKDSYPEIPFSQMWETDWVWFPLLLSKRKFIGRADFTRKGDVYEPFRWWYGEAK